MADKKKQATWGGRFKEPLDPHFMEWSSSWQFDQKMATQDLAVNRAHVKQLRLVGYLTKEEEEKFFEGFEAIERSLEQGSFVWESAYEDLHMNLEQALKKEIGELADKLHTGRSRNDQVATDLRLWIRDAWSQKRGSLVTLLTVLYEQAKGSQDLLFPGLTHFQIAQPIRLSHYWLAYFWKFSRDIQRFDQCVARLNESPLGSGAFAGTSLRTDRRQAAQELGFFRPMPNTLDAVSSRDFVLEFIGVCSQVMLHLSGMCEELIQWSTPAWSLYQFSDAFSTGSSMMPQKKNPDLAELVRGASAEVLGCYQSCASLLKGMPLTYNRDFQHEKKSLFYAWETTLESVELFAKAIPKGRFNKEYCRYWALSGGSWATDLAEGLVEKGIAFRQAHHLVGEFIAYLEQAEIALEEVSDQDLVDFDKRFVGLEERLCAEKNLELRDDIAGQSKRALTEQLDLAKESLEAISQVGIEPG